MSLTINSLIDKYADNHFTHLIKDKRVIVVGPDTSLIGRGLGKYIDSFDTVVRHNTVLEYLPFNKKLQLDFGSRTDVLYLSPQCIKDYSFKDSYLNRIRTSMVKFVVYMNGNRNNEYLIGDYCFPKNLDYFKKNLTKLKIPMHYSHHTTGLLTELMCNHKTNVTDKIESDAGVKILDTDEKYTEEKNTEEKNTEITVNSDNINKIVPRVGFISIFDMIIHGAKSVEILGMSFYHGGGHAFRKEVKKQLDPRKNAIGKDSAHDSIVELSLLTDMMMVNYPQIQWSKYHHKDMKNN